MDAQDFISTLDAQPGVARLVAGVFGFDVSSGSAADAFDISSGVALHTVAGDAAGGTFLLVGSLRADRPVLYVSSEGQAGLISGNLTEALEMFVGLPCWQDCLTFSGDGDLAVMSATAEYSLRDLTARNVDLPFQQAKIAEKLSLTLQEPALLLARLHAAVSGTRPDYVISDEDGEYESLFGQFRPDRNPRWR